MMRQHHHYWQSEQESSNGGRVNDLDVSQDFEGDMNLGDVITSISIEPVFNDNKFTDFNP
jgi:hypothetical protein